MFWLKLLTFICIKISLVASLVSISTNFWIEHENAHHQGLYFFCNDEDLGCQKFEEDPAIKLSGVPDWHLAVFYLMILAIILHILAFICNIILCVTERWIIFNIILATLVVVAWLSICTAMGTYTQKFYNIFDTDGYSWGYSFILGWVSWTANTAAAILSIILAMVQQRINNKNWQ